MTPSERFKELRKRLGMRQIDASAYLDITERGIQWIEANTARADTLKALNGKMLRENLRTMSKQKAADIYDGLDSSIMENKE